MSSGLSARASRWISLAADRCLISLNVLILSPLLGGYGMRWARYRIFIASIGVRPCLILKKSIGVRPRLTSSYTNRPSSSLYSGNCVKDVAHYLNFSGNVLMRASARAYFLIRPVNDQKNGLNFFIGVSLFTSTSLATSQHEKTLTPSPSSSLALMCSLTLAVNRSSL